MFSKGPYKTHQRHSSMEVKHEKTKSPISNLKSIHAMKEMLFQTNSEIGGLNSNSNIISNVGNISKNTKNTKNVSNNSQIILNQGGVPCFNNINIFTNNATNNNNNNPSKDINLRQYIFNRTNKPKSLSKMQPGHVRSSSINNN